MRTYVQRRAGPEQWGAHGVGPWGWGERAFVRCVGAAGSVHGKVFGVAQFVWVCGSLIGRSTGPPPRAPHAEVTEMTPTRT